MRSTKERVWPQHFDQSGFTNRVDVQQFVTASRHTASIDVGLCRVVCVMRFVLSVVVALCMLSASAHARMFQGEEMMNPAGVPAVTHFLKGSGGKPLIVLVAGSGNTGRIFYGPHEGADPDQFLATHLNALGYNVLSVSTPITTGDPIFALNYPGFTIREWGKLLVKVAAKHVTQHDLSPDVILAGWSMGGKAAQSMSVQAQDAGISVALFVSLSATPPVLGVLPIVTDYPMNPDTGYGRAPDPEFKGLLWNIKVNARREGVDDIIPPEDVIAHYVGEGPVGLGHTGIRYHDGQIIADQLGDLRDGQGHDFAGFPLIATIIPQGRHDLRHTVTDRHTWGMITTNRLYQTVLEPNLKKLRHVSNEDLDALARLISTAPERLSKDINGNHFFFVGETGARQTAEAISWLDAEARKLMAEIESAMQDAQQRNRADLK